MNSQLSQLLNSRHIISQFLLGKAFETKPIDLYSMYECMLENKTKHIHYNDTTSIKSDDDLKTRNGFEILK